MGSHFSGSLTIILYATSNVLTSMDSTSSGLILPTFSTIFNAASTALIAWYSTGQYFMLVSITLKPAPSWPARTGISKDSLHSATLNTPNSPSNMGAGPVIPRQARSAANNPFLAALAAAQPFHMLSSPALVCLSAQLLVSA